MTPAQAKRICASILAGATADDVHARDPRISILALRVAERAIRIAVEDLVVMAARAEVEAEAL